MTELRIDGRAIGPDAPPWIVAELSANHLGRLDRALAAETPLSVDGREIRLDPPSWLILPQRDGAPG